MKFRNYLASLPRSTKPLIEGCNATKANFEMLNFCDKHNLSRTKATYIDNDGNLQLKDNYQDFKLTQREKLKSELSYRS